MVCDAAHDPMSIPGSSDDQYRIRCPLSVVALTDEKGFVVNWGMRQINRFFPKSDPARLVDGLLMNKYSWH